MYYYHGHKKRKNWFENWIFKFQNHSMNIVFIPRIEFDEKARATVFLDVFLDKLYSISFFMEDFNSEENQLSIRLNNCYFTERGCSLNLQTQELSIKGRINYDLNLSSTWSDFFASFISVYQHHAIISPFHSLSGILVINSKEWDFNGGMGYIEMNWGKRSKHTFIWNQSLWKQNQINSISLLANQFSFFNWDIKTCLLAFYGEEVQVIFNAPIQAKILKMNSEELIVTKNEYRFELKRLKEHHLLSNRVLYRLYIRDECVFFKEMDSSSFINKEIS